MRKLINEEQTVRDVLKDKHPNGQKIPHNSIFNTDCPGVASHPVIFEEINSQSIQQAALHTDGSAGPSGLDAYAWRRMCSSFQKASHDLCAALAMTARRLASTFVDPEPLKPFTACRLIALDKCPGVRPIGVGEVSHRIVSKCILNVIRSDIADAVGSSQLCASLKGACEAAVHALKEVFTDDSTEGVLMVDASNAFNSLNRKAALRNTLNICPTLGVMLTNTYRMEPSLFIDGECILSREGTTQGDPLAMAMYAIATLPLIYQLRQPETKQVWYADYSAAAGLLVQLRTWWDKIVELGPAFGCYANQTKTWLVVKEQFFSEVKSVFKDTELKITTAGRSYLGLTVGDGEFTEAFIKNKVEHWVSELETLSSLATSQSQAAYAALIHSIQHKWSYLTRTTENISSLLQPLEDVIRHKLIPAITGKKGISDGERQLFALPTRLGGLAIEVLPEVADKHFHVSKTIAEPLSHAIVGQAELSQSQVIRAEQELRSKCIRQERRQAKVAAANSVKSQLSGTTRRAMTLSEEKGSSAWLNTIPIDEHGFTLNKGEFRDALALRYGWRPNGLPSTCGCGPMGSTMH